MAVEKFNPKYYINVANKMMEKGLAFKRPRMKKNFVYDKDDGFVRIIGVDTFEGTNTI